jgi:uncharacterized protein (TIGR04255 family)
LAKAYPKAPIVEAVCEFQFSSPQAWDWTIPGLLYQEIQSEFPEKREERAFEINVRPGDHNPVQHFGNALTKLQFVRADGKSMVQVGPDLLAVNVQAPYPGWNVFLHNIARQFEIYSKIAQPKGFKRIGLRYINHIKMSAASVELTDYFHFYPHLAPTVDQTHGPFLMRVMHERVEGRDAMSVTLGSVVPATGLIFALDIDYYLLRPDGVSLDKGIDWIERAHASIEEMFEACITDKTRELLGEPK